MPRVATLEEWQAEIDVLRRKEKELTRAHDAVNALRRRLPMVKVAKSYEFEGEEGKVSLLDLFGDRKQLIVYHFMFGPDAEVGCPGCSWVTDAMTHPAHLHARDTSLVLISRASIEKLMSFRARMHWDLPWYSSLHSNFNYDFNATNEEGENHVTSVFLRDGTTFTGPITPINVASSTLAATGHTSISRRLVVRNRGRAHRPGGQSKGCTGPGAR
jgi:predicted dithiol-disulfide oxidoreductase (DUF899 family)